jgi:pimeloyl-ACP methyl ester carboxylesterase
MDAFPRGSVETKLGPVSVRQGKGAGPCLFLLHGIGGNADGWRKQYAAFGNDFRVVGWDAPGYGGSFNFANASPGLEEYAAAFVAVLDALDVGKALVVGHSLGGLIAACAAAKYPSRIERLVLAACSSGHATYEEAKRQSILKTRLDAFSTGDVTAYARSRVKNLLSADPSPEIVEEAVRVMAQIRQPGFPQATRMVSASDVFPYLPQIKAPTRVLCGTADQVTPPALNQKIAGSIPNADYVSIEGAGHWSFIEFPDQFNTAVRQFVQ